MCIRAIRRSILDPRWLAVSTPPTFLLPNRLRHFNSTTPIIDDGNSIPAGLEPTQLSNNIPKHPPFAASPTPTSSTSLSSSSTPQPAPHPSLRTLLPLLKAQQQHYITVHIHARPYLLTVGDAVRLPFQMPGVAPGDILRLNRASIIGSRDYTLKGAPYVDERLFECRARVMGVEAEPMRVEEKTKRRQRRVKTVKNKLKYTVLKLADLKIRTLDEVGL